jgi:ribose transport system permease protein
MIIVFSILKPVFISFNNVMSILLSTCVTGVLGLGVTFVIIAGGIDLSVGTVMIFSSVIVALSISTLGLPIIPGILLALAAGGICGFINGFGVAKLKLPPFIATLAMMRA